ncbi:small serum protein 2-like [Neoarius graeffei]|uniref:small serum protein 2-like n=1 Tax=Neoarius graeffei TaxID=443677 RepID=UPI00298CDF1C|nr:small serum protein 2-like [Neoarius graeffei]
MRSVFVAFFVIALIPVIQPACWHQLIEADATHCQDAFDKTWHPVGSRWKNSHCQGCSCDAEGMGCCDGLPASVSGGCTIKYDYKTCTYELIPTDKDVPCSAIGK